MSDITVEQLKSKVDEWHAKRGECDQLSEVLTEKNKELEKIGFELIQMMEQVGVEKFEGELGKVRIHEDESVSMPADEDKKLEFIEYLKSLGEWDTFATIHHHKLNSWYKNKMEEHGPMFMAPGLDLPKVRKSIRKSR